MGFEQSGAEHRESKLARKNNDLYYFALFPWALGVRSHDILVIFRGYEVLHAIRHSRNECTCYIYHLANFHPGPRADI